MKRTILISTLLGTLTLSCFSQVDTTSTDSITFTLNRAKQIAVELTERDECLERADLYKAEIINLKFTSDRQNEKIFALEENATRSTAINAESTAQLDIVNAELSKAARRLKRQKMLTYVVGAAGAGVATLLLLRP